jgi:hypothetical protein
MNEHAITKLVEKTGLLGKKVLIFEKSDVAKNTPIRPILPYVL